MNRAWKVISQMGERSGRLEKRIPLAVPVEISSLLDQARTERTITENVSPLGIRILTERPRDLNDRLIISSLVGNLRSLARVVYCQRLPDGRFALGLQFQRGEDNWPRVSWDAGTELPRW